MARASVSTDGAVVGAIDRGLLVLVGFTAADDDSAVEWMAEKVAGLRIFPDADDKMNQSVTDIGGALLIVSQFTLYGDASKGRRPSFVHAAPPERAEPLYDAFVAAVRRRGVRAATGVFGARMEVSLVNDGPVTLVVDR